MKRQSVRLKGITTRGLISMLAGLVLASLPARACTIFVLTDTNRALFCNNEDWLNPKTRIWFVPAGEGYYGAAYVGFNDGWAQGGLNTEGLAFDWVAGFNEKWEPDTNLPSIRGDSSRRMLESCATVKDAIAFHRSHREAGFWRAKILVADRSGASVIIGATNGQLQVEPDDRCRGFGFGRQTLNLALAQKPEPTAINAFKILRDCRQPGQYATKYSNVFDLKTGDIFLYPFPDQDDEVKFNLAAELKKGGHYYDMPQIKEQLAQAPRPLLLNMKRFPIDEYKPIPDREPEVTAHFRAMVYDIAGGTPKSADYAAEAWKKIEPNQKAFQAEAQKLGDLTALTLVGRSEENDLRAYLYRMEFANATILERFVLDRQNRTAAGETEAVEWKPGVKLPDPPTPPLVGIGMALDMTNRSLVVIGILPNSPAAAQKEIHVGDRILAVAQDTGPMVPVQSDKTAQALAMIRGPAGTTVRLKIASAGEDDSRARVVSFERAEIKLPPR
jgi:hypothetical protein